MRYLRHGWSTELRRDFPFDGKHQILFLKSFKWLLLTVGLGPVRLFSPGCLATTLIKRSKKP